MIGFKETDLGSIPNDWGFVRFEKVAELRHGHQFRSYDFTEDGIKIVKITQIKGNGNMDISSCSFVDINRIDEFQGDIIMKGDILIALTGATIGKIARCNSHEVLLQNYRVGNFFSKNEKKLCRNYLYQFLRSNYFFHQILARQTQSAQQNIGKDEINSMNLFLPSIEEQKAIAKVLTAFDDKIELLQAQNKTLETMAQTIFKEWFGKYQIGDELPDGWKVGRLRDLGDIICGKTPSKADKENFGGNIPFIKIPDMHNQMFIIKTSDSLTKKGVSTQKNKLIPKNSICVSCIATVGLVSITSKDSQTNQQINSILPFNDSCREFIYFKVKGLHKYLQDIGSGGTATLNVNTRSFSNIEIIIPNIKKLNAFNIIVNPMFEKIFDNYSQIESLTKTRDTLLPKLMSGQVRVNKLKQTADA